MALRLIALSPLVGVRFQILFHSPRRGVFHFSVALLSAIGRRGVFSLGGWAPRIPASFHETRSTREFLEKVVRCHLRDYHPLWSSVPEGSVTVQLWNFLGALRAPRGSHNPPCTTAAALHAGGLGFCAFARHYLRNRCSLSFPGGT
jgi:hypothetical protein